MIWKTREEFFDHYHDIITKLIVGCVEEESWYLRHLDMIAYQLWFNCQSWVKRSWTGLAFDVVYIVANASGNKVSLPLLTYIGEQELQRTVIPMQNKSKHEGSERWFVNPRGFNLIVDALAGKEQLAREVLEPWMSGEEE